VNRSLAIPDVEDQPAAVDPVRGVPGGAGSSRTGSAGSRRPGSGNFSALWWT
jgi:hypothetical protein